MSALDWLVILAYLAVMLYIGYHSMKTVKTDEDFVLAGRNVGNIYIILSLFASFTGLSGLFGTPQYVYEYGIAGWWWWATFPIGVFIMGMTMAKLLRRRMHVTLPDVVDVNHSSKAVRVAASLVTVWNYLAWTAGQVAGIVLVITTFTDLNGTAAVIVAYCSLHAAGRFPGGSVYRFPAGSPLSCGPGPCYPCGTAASLQRARGPGSNHFYRRILQAFWQCARRNYDYLVAPGSRRFY